MGNPKQKWTSEEEEALRAGVAKHGTGKWKDIQRDPEFNTVLFSRTNIDLKDKWRNMSVSASQHPRDKSRTPKIKPNPDVPTTTPLAILNTSTAAPVANVATTDPNMDDSKSLMDGKNASRYNAMIFEALSTLKEPDGLDTGKIVSFIEKRHEVPQNFRRLLSTRLRRLVAQDKLEKVQNCFKLKNDASSETPTQKQDIQCKQLQSIGDVPTEDTIKEVAEAAAYKIAEAENKLFVAAEAIKEAERISKMAEDTDSLLQLAKEIFEKCSQGQVVFMA